MKSRSFLPRTQLGALVGLIATSALLTACGGGSGDSAGANAAAASSSTSTPSDATTTAGATITTTPVTTTESAQAATKALAGTDATPTTLIVKARGVLAGGVGPTIEIRVNGLLVATTEVRSATLQDYSYSVVGLGAGSAVDVVYTNDAVAGGVDRNLWVNSITVGGVSYASTSSGVVFDRGSGSAAFDGVDTIPGQEGLFWNGALRFQIPGGTAAATASTGVYVDAANGNDNNPGTEALPWKTLRKVTEVRLTTGQSVFLRCNRVWRESLSLDTVQLTNGTSIVGYGGDCATAKALSLIHI